MKKLDGGITRDGEAYHGRMLNILGQRYFPKASCEASFAFETNSEPGQFVPVHVHPTPVSYTHLDVDKRQIPGRGSAKSWTCAACA